MLIILLLLIIRTIPFEASLLICRAGFYIYLLFSERSRRQLLKAEIVLGGKRFRRKQFIKKLAFNVAVMARIGTAFTRRLSETAILEGAEHLEDLIKGNNTAVIATFHYGPWELIAEVFTAKGYKIGALVTKRPGLLVDSYFSSLRRRAGLQITHSLKQATSLTRKGFFMASLFDRTLRAKSNDMNFPYPDYQTSRLPLILAARIRQPLVPVICRFMK
ncbi:hypothetical protein GF359_07640, partial [candidate division WOR-3 bacterium]|nr:hypothetical protein [candidate division WOR-3 bacterium]MBD3365073.1 hypothetical protein [candidate division WOR-3 bacterium]